MYLSAGTSAAACSINEKTEENEWFRNKKADFPELQSLRTTYLLVLLANKEPLPFLFPYNICKDKQEILQRFD